MLWLFKPNAFKVYIMSETPQSDSVESEVTDQQVEINDSVVESDTTSQVQDESKEQVDEVQLAKDKANDAFNKQYGQLKQAERDRDANQAKLAEFEKTERERQAAAVGTLPEILDPLDDGYEESLERYKQAVNAQANYNASNNAYLDNQKLQQQQVAQAKQVKQNKAMAAYATKATELGIKQEELTAAAGIVSNYGLSDDLVMHILGDSDGPLITKHLAANPHDGYQLAQMSPFEVGSFLTNIKTKASALKPKTSNTPDPATNLQGNGVDPEMGKYAHIKGAKFE